MTDAISRFPVPDPADVPDDLRKVMEDNLQKAGFVPNVFRAYAHKPDHFRAFFQYYEVLMRAGSGLSPLAPLLAFRRATRWRLY